MHKYAKYAFFFKIAKTYVRTAANLAIKQRIDVSRSLEGDYRVNSLGHRPNNIAPNVVKPPTVQWLGITEKVPSSVTIINESE